MGYWRWRALWRFDRGVGVGWDKGGTVSCNDGTLIEAWASQKSFRPKDGSGDDDGGANFHGQKRKNDTHASTSDPDTVFTARPPGGRRNEEKKPDAETSLSHTHNRPSEAWANSDVRTDRC
jgi:hypothetical protein